MNDAYFKEKAACCMTEDKIERNLFDEFGVKRGLRDFNGKGVLTGLTNISKIESSKVMDGKSVPCDGKLWFRGYEINDLVNGIGDRGFEEVAYLLLMGELPDREELDAFCKELNELRRLPQNFTRDVIMKAPGQDIMNSMTKSVLTLASYDDRVSDNSVENVDISPESIEAGRASIYINKELQRVDIASLNALENKNVITRFPSLSSRCTTVQVLKSPKTDSSIRTIFLPKTVAEMLVEFKAEQDMTKEALGAEYADYNLVVAGPLGMPTEQSTINGALKQLIEENDLPKVVFHSFRHSSITYKLKLNGGDIKAVQGDSGHAQASMVTEQYAHILDDDRRLNAQRFDDFFYQHHGAEPEALPRAEQSTPKASPVDTDAAAALAKLLADPSMATLIKNLAKNL